VYPSDELNRLARHKQALQRRITRRRQECVAAVAGIARPFGWLDRALAMWRQLSPWMQLAAVPLGFLMKGRTTIRPVGTLLRWLPVISGLVRSFVTMRTR
jgi:hypothetical protein